MERFQFFNKQDGVVDDLNLAFQQAYLNFQTFVKTHYTEGWLQSSSNRNFFGITIALPTFSISTSGVDYVNINAGNNIAGINQNGDLIFINTNTAYQNSDSTINSGNTNIPINTSASAQPYTRYVWIQYREVSDPTQTRVDYDGGLQGGTPPFTSPPFPGPVKHNGYNVIVSDNDPSVYGVADGLYVGSITVSGGVQAYSYAGSTVPFYQGRLVAGVCEESVRIDPDFSSATTSYSSLVPATDRGLTLKDHINAFGSAVVTANNPHGTSAADAGALDALTMTDITKIMRNGILLPPGAATTTDTAYAKMIINNDITPSITIPNNVYFLYNGKYYQKSDLSVITLYTSDFTSGTGWYAIKIGQPTTGVFAVQTFFERPYFFRYENDDNIYLGYVYYNSTTQTFQLNESQVASTGDGILPYYSWGVTNSKFTSKDTDPYSTTSENLIVAPPPIFGLSQITCGIEVWCNVGGVVSFDYGSSGNYQMSMGSTVVTAIATMRANTKQINTQAVPSENFSYSYSFDYYVPNTSQAPSNIKVLIGTQTYYLPVNSNGSWLRFRAVLNFCAPYIEIDLTENVGVPGTYIQVNNIKVVKGFDLSDVYKSPLNYTNQVILDTTVSVDGTGNPIERRIQLATLDAILQMIPLQTLPLSRTSPMPDWSTEPGASNSFHRFSTDTTNLVMQIFQVAGGAFDQYSDGISHAIIAIPAGYTVVTMFASVLNGINTADGSSSNQHLYWLNHGKSLEICYKSNENTDLENAPFFTGIIMFNKS